MCVRCGEMAAEVERLQSVIDEANVRVWAEAARVLENSDAPKAAQFWRQGVVNLFRNRAATAAHPIPAQQSPAVAVHELKDIKVTDQMASAFNQAICDDAMNDQDLEEVKTGLRAAISHLHPMPKSFYELEIERLVALNDSLLANEIRLIERLRTMQPSPPHHRAGCAEDSRNIHTVVGLRHLDKPSFAKL